MNTRFSLRMSVLISQVLVLTSCCLSGPSKQLISWENYDFDDGLGKPSLALSKGFVGTPIEGGASIREFSVHTNGSVKTIWGVSNAVVRSNDTGDSWQIIEDSMKNEQLGFEGPYCICFDSSNTLWVATRQRVWQSADDGVSWSCVYQGPAGIQCVGYNDIEVQGTTIWLVSDAGTLTKILTNTLQVTETYPTSSQILDVMPSSNGRLFISTNDLVMVSNNGGVSFSTFAHVSGARDLVDVNGSIYYCASGSVFELGTDGAVLWSLDPPPGQQYGSLDSANGSVYALSACSSGNCLAKIDTLSNHAVTVTDLGGKSSGGDVYLDEDGVLYIGLSGRILISPDGGSTLEEHPFGLSTVNVIQSRYGQTWAGLRGSGAAFFQPGTSSWQTVGANLERGMCFNIESVAIISSSRVILAGGPEPEVAITTDGGSTFQFAWFGPDDGSFFWARTLAEDSHGSLFLLLSYRDAAGVIFSARVYRSDDQGSSWLHASDFCQEQHGEPHGTLVIDEGRSCSWAALSPYNLQDGCFFRGDRQGSSWERLSEMGFDKLTDACLDASGNLYILGRGADGIGIYRLAADETWLYIPKPYALDLFPKGLTVDADGCYWLASEVGLFYTSNGGSSWIHFTKQDGLASDIVNDVFIEGQGTGRVVWVGTALGASRGVFAP